MDRAELLDYTALGLSLAGVLAGLVSAYLFIEGEDPDRYERFHGLESSDQKPKVIMGPEGLMGVGWEF